MVRKPWRKATAILSGTNRSDQGWWCYQGISWSGFLSIERDANVFAQT